MRFFLRVDGVLSRIYDTRLYHEFQTDYLIREYSEKEKGFKEMRVSLQNDLVGANLYWYSTNHRSMDKPSIFIAFAIYTLKFHLRTSN